MVSTPIVLQKPKIFKPFRYQNNAPSPYLEVMLVAELTLHVDTLGQRLRLRSMAMVCLQALHLPGLDVNLGVLHLRQTTGRVLDLE